MGRKRIFSTDGVVIIESINNEFFNRYYFTNRETLGFERFNNLLVTQVRI